MPNPIQLAQDCKHEKFFELTRACQACGIEVSNAFVYPPAQQINKILDALHEATPHLIPSFQHYGLDDIKEIIDKLTQVDKLLGEVHAQITRLENGGD